MSEPPERVKLAWDKNHGWWESWDRDVAVDYIRADVHERVVAAMAPRMAAMMTEIARLRALLAAATEG
jgi:hypothetical protein